MVVCSAPGKILWIGGYAVLERPNVSLVSGVDKRVYAEAIESQELRFVSNQFDFDFASRFDGEKVACVNDKAKFVCFAAEVCLRYLRAKNIKTKNFTLTTFSDPAFGVGDKAGLGSSAAVTVASVAAIMALHDYDVNDYGDLNLVHKLAQFSHSEAQGGKIGSGFELRPAFSARASTCVIRLRASTRRVFPLSLTKSGIACLRARRCLTSFALQ